MVDPDLEISERPVIQTFRKGAGGGECSGLQRKIFRPLWPQFGLKIRSKICREKKSYSAVYLLRVGYQPCERCPDVHQP